MEEKIELMLKRLLIIFIFFAISFTHAAFAQEIFKVTSVNFDTSNSLLFLTSPDNTSESLMKNVKLIKLQNPKRIYFDINSAVLTTSAQNWYLNSGGVKQVKINQFSTNPSKIRIVIYTDEDFNQSKIKFLKVNNNLVIRFKDDSTEMCKNVYFQNTYRDERASSSDFYENLSISNEEIEKAKTALKAKENEIVLNQIQQAFNITTAPATAIKPVSVKSSDAINKELKLKSKYYLSEIIAKTNGFLINGFGVIGFERPMYLTNPTRVVFDIPNAIINSDIKNQEIKIGQDSVKVSQYTPNKARIVITSTELEKYFPIFSADGQTVCFSKTENLDLDSLFTKTNDAVSYYTRKINAQTNEFIIAFSSPVVHSVRRTDSKLSIDMYNALRYNERDFLNTINNTDLRDLSIHLLPKVGLKLTLPLEKNSMVTSFLGADGKSIKIVVRNIIPKSKIHSSERNVTLPGCPAGKSSVVLDAGHGGSDYGAIRCGINEKDLNLDIIKRVQSILMNKGVSVYLTRNTDDSISLQDRTIFCENASPDIFVSVHVNSSTKTEISGIETHYYHEESMNLAQDVHTSMISYIKAKDRGLFKSKFYVINHTQVPAILVEIGFISNESERSELVSEARKQQTAKAIADGILKYLNKR